MTDSSNVIQLRPKPPANGYDGRVCECGEAWFLAYVAIEADGRVGSYAVPIKCMSCGKEAK